MITLFSKFLGGLFTIFVILIIISSSVRHAAIRTILTIAPDPAFGGNVDLQMKDLDDRFSKAINPTLDLGKAIKKEWDKNIDIELEKNPDEAKILNDVKNKVSKVEQVTKKKSIEEQDTRGFVRELTETGKHDIITSHKNKGG